MSQDTTIDTAIEYFNSRRVSEPEGHMPATAAVLYKAEMIPANMEDLGISRVQGCLQRCIP